MNSLSSTSKYNSAFEFAHIHNKNGPNEKQHSEILTSTLVMELEQMERKRKITLTKKKREMKKLPDV